jgi:8-oxo-dGTP diphosphatase
MTAEAQRHEAMAVKARQCVEIAVAVVERGDQFLIGRRGENVVLAGFWEFPGGKIEPGESREAAAERECLEETGLAIDVGRPHCVVEHDYEHARVRLHFLACTPRDLQATPREPFHWVPRSALGEYRFPPANDALLRMLCE